MTLAVGSRRIAVLSGMAAGVASFGLGLVVLSQHLTTDFMVLWAAGRSGAPYDPATLRPILAHATTAALGHTLWPFPYAPPFLLFCKALALLPLPVAYLAWITASGAALAASARAWLAPLIVASPAVFYAILGGQTSCMVGALMLAGLTVSVERPRLAGVLLGVAAVIKPQLVFLAPVGLLVAGEIEVVVAMVATGVALSALSAIVLGPGVWIAWVKVLPGAAANYASISPHLTLAPAWLWALGLAIGLALVAWTFRRPDPTARHIACAATALLCGPHSLWYDAAILAPAAIRYVRLDWRAGPSLVFLVLKPTCWTVAVGALAAGHLRKRWVGSTTDSIEGIADRPGLARRGELQRADL